eukprot:COSAG04_NODE_2905_length_3400_cov_3.600727_2_plen_177_part_00
MPIVGARPAGLGCWEPTKRPGKAKMPSHKTCECLPTPRTARRTRRRPLAPPPARLAPTAPSPPWERSFSLGRGAEQLLRRVRSPREEDPGEEAEAEPAGSAVDPFPHRQHRAPPSRLPQTSAPVRLPLFFPPCSHVRLRVLRPDPVQQQAETLAADQDRPLNGPAVGLCRRRPLGV